MTPIKYTLKHWHLFASSDGNFRNIPPIALIDASDEEEARDLANIYLDGALENPLEAWGYSLKGPIETPPIISW